MKLRMRITALMLSIVMLVGLIPTASAAGGAITSFTVIEDCTIYLDSYPGADAVAAMLPASVSATVDGSEQDIPVSWDIEQETSDWYICWADWGDSYYLSGFDTQDYCPFYEVIIGSEETNCAAEESVSSTGIANIVARAYQQVQIEWTPVADVNGYLNSSGELTATFEAGVTYSGIPYGQPVSPGKYVPFSATFDEFLNAVADGTSLFYTSRGANGSLTSTYYASDCSAFVSYCYGLSRMTTYTIGMSDKFTTVSSLSEAQVGDCMNSSSHVVLISGINYNADGSIASYEISEQTPPKARTSIYSVSRVQQMLSSGYTILRFNERDTVGAPQSYSGYGVTTTHISACGIALEYSVGTYTGSPLTPAVTVTYNGTTLTKGTDYQVTYYNNTNPGTATVIIAGLGKYSGTTTTTFNIQQETAPNPMGFTDVPTTYWAYSYILKAYNLGIVNGRSATIFDPESNTTRGEAITMIYRLAGSPAVSGTPTFIDLTETYYVNAIYWGQKNGIVNGYSSTIFAPSANVTRQDFCTMLYRLAGSPATNGSLTGFTDAGQVASYAVNAMKWAVENGIMNGRTSTTLVPTGNAKRAEITTMLMRYYDMTH